MVSIILNCLALKFRFVQKHWSVYLHFQCLFTFSVCLFTFSMFVYILGLFIYIFQCLFTFFNVYLHFSMFIYKIFRNFLKFKAWKLKFRFVYILWFVYLHFSMFIYILGLFIYIFQCLFTFFNVYLQNFSKFSKI